MRGTILRFLPRLFLAGAVACSGEDPGAGGTPASGGTPAVSSTGGVSAGGSGATVGGAVNGGTITGGSSTGGATGGTSGGSPAGALGGGGSTGGGSQTTGGGATGGEAGQNGGQGGATGGSTAGGAASGGAAGAGGVSGGGTSAGGVAGSSGTAGGGASGSAGSGGSAGQGGSGGSSQSSICPPGITQTITVAKSGGQFSSVQAAVDSIPSGSSTHIRIDVGAGTYREKITIASRTNLCLVGASTETTVLTYDDNNAAVGSTSGTFSVLVSADDFSAANLTIENSFGTGSQAVALRVTGDRQQFLNCRFVGYQDTLYVHQGLQYFRDCYVQGNTDYVFGHATAILENCEVRNVEGGSAVAAPNTESSLAYGIVFLGGRFTAAGSVNNNSVALGRPWGADGAAAYLNVELGAHVSSAGFVPMSDNDPANARFREYQSTGPGANASAHSGYQMNASEAASYTVQTVLGGWVPSYSQ